jgi:hypothetical protein
MISVAAFVMLALVITYVLRAVLLSWSGQETRAGIDISLDRGVEEIVRDLREARQITSTNDEIRFTQDLSSYYIYYFYNSNDTYPLTFNQTAYELRKAQLVGNISGNFTYGAGNITVIDVLPPPASDLSVSGNLTTIEISINRKGETIRSRTQVRPRNL